MLTARAEEADHVRGLELGADDYVAKPFSPNDLVARIRALVRRSRRSEPTGTVLRPGPIVVDLSRHTVSSEGHEVKLTAKEFMLLQYFLEHRGRVLSRDLLLGEALVTVKQFGYKLVDDEAR